MIATTLIVPVGLLFSLFVLWPIRVIWNHFAEKRYYTRRGNDLYDQIIADMKRTSKENQT
jgi:hypothetical protein